MKLEIGSFYNAKVEKLLDFGAVVRIDDSRTTYLIHISNISDKFVKSVEEYVSVGNTYRVVAIPGKVKDVELSMKESDVAKYSNAG